MSLICTILYDVRSIKNAMREGKKNARVVACGTDKACWRRNQKGIQFGGAWDSGIWRGRGREERERDDVNPMEFEP